MLKNILSSKLILVLILLTSLILVTGCSNDKTGLSNITSNYDVNFSIVDENEDPIEGVLVTLDGKEKSTDKNGIVSFSKLNGTYHYSIAATGYEAISDKAIVSDDNLSINIKLDILYNVNFNITDTNDKPLEGAIITFDGEDKSTGVDGKVTFSSSDGSYEYNITAEGYETAYDTAVVNGNNLPINKQLVKLTSTYNVNFTIRDTNDNPIIEAIVELEGENNKTTDSNGMTSFTKSDGSYNYSVSADGYAGDSGITVIDGADETINIILSSLVDEYNINFTIIDINANPIEGATVSLDGEDKDTNNNGVATFSKADGTYNYDVTAPNYVDNTNNSIIVNGTDLTEEVSLKLKPPTGYIGIYNWEDLNNVRNDVSADYILMNNLDSNTEGYEEYASGTANNGKGWDPIGTGETLFPTHDSNIFIGTFNGNDKTISNLIINRPHEDFIGLFSTISGENVVINLGLEIDLLSGNNYVGGLSGTLKEPPNNYVSVSNCYSTGVVTGNSYIGGLIGQTIDANIDKCFSSTLVAGDGESCGGLLGELLGSNCRLSNSYATGYIEGFSRVGGLIGYTEAFEITRCYTDKQVVATGDRIGGLIGELMSGTVRNCYAHGDVSGRDYNIGGLIGQVMSGGYISKCYATGTVTATNDLPVCGGLVGTYEGIEKISDSFSLDNASYEITGDRDESLLTGRSTEAPKDDMQSDLIYTQETNLDGYNDMNQVWDNKIWNFGTETNPNYPSLSWE
ncbi:MAG: GLUG motif-containing protein [Bacillota bacterium]